MLLCFCHAMQLCHLQCRIYFFHRGPMISANTRAAWSGELLGKRQARSTWLKGNTRENQGGFERRDRGQRALRHCALMGPGAITLVLTCAVRACLHMCGRTHTHTHAPYDFFAQTQHGSKRMTGVRHPNHRRRTPQRRVAWRCMAPRVRCSQQRSESALTG